MVNGVLKQTRKIQNPQEATNLLGILDLPCQIFKKKTFTKIEAHEGMADRLVIDWAIEEAL